MQQKLHHAKLKAGCLLSLSGMAMSAAFFLHEGRADMLSAPPPHHSILIESTSSMMTRFFALKKDAVSSMTALHPESHVDTLESNSEERVEKKKFGLAILFLGVLAEKS